MLTKPTVEQLLPKTENRYILSMLTAKRARQLIDGAKPLIDSKTENMVSLAAEEIYADAVKSIKGKVEVHVPLRPEVEAERLTAELEAEAKNRENRQHETNRFSGRFVQQNNRKVEVQNEINFAGFNVAAAAEHLTNANSSNEQD